MKNDTEDDAPASWYEMNPAEDAVLFTRQLAEGMLVLNERNRPNPMTLIRDTARARSQQFAQILYIQRNAASGSIPETGFIILEWPDGHQESREAHPGYSWLVKSASIGTSEPPAPLIREVVINASGDTMAELESAAWAEADLFAGPGAWLAMGSYEARPSGSDHKFSASVPFTITFPERENPS